MNMHGLTETSLKYLVNLGKSFLGLESSKKKVKGLFKKFLKMSNSMQKV